MKILLLRNTQVLWLIALVTVLQGCATYFASEMAPDDKKFYSSPVLTDKILAIGRPDAALLKQMDLSNTIAFIGKEHTYMLYLGGEELEQISKLKLDLKRLSIKSDQSLFLKDKQIWGEIELTYSVGNKEVTALEMAELKQGGFTQEQGSKKNGHYRTSIKIEGVLYPAIKIPDEHISKLKVQRNLNLYNPRESTPPVLVKAMKAPLVITGVAVDIMLAPVYLGVGAIVLVGAIASGM